MCRLLLWIVCFHLFVIKGRGQQEDAVWVFAHHSGVDFTTVLPTPFVNNIDGFGEANAPVSDADGNLLFYTEGSLAWDRLRHLMPNGGDLTGVVSVNTGACWLQHYG